VNLNAKIASADSASTERSPPQTGGRVWRGEFHRLRLRLYALLLASDALCMTLAFLIANQLRFGDAFASYGMNTLGVLFPIYVAVGINGNAWQIWALQNPRHSVAAALRAFCLALAVATILFFSLKIGEDFSRLVFGIGSLLALLLVGISRYVLGRLIGDRFDWTFRREILLLDSSLVAPIRNEVVVDAAEENLLPVTDDPVMLDRLGRLLDRCERVTLACPNERRRAWVGMLASANVDVEVLAPELNELGALGVRSHGGCATLMVARGPLGLRDRFLKRLLDLLVAITALVLLAPAFALTALAIKAESRGPILFRQPRVGRGNRIFEMLKFRSMRHDSADREGSQSTARRDVRVTKVGQFMRSTSLDELPQLINVLKGEMSIVGPRPHAIQSTVDDRNFWSIDASYIHRHGIKPGMTGLAQIRGFRGATLERSDLTNRLKADLEYVDGWHIGRDLWIMVLTLGVLIHPNAF
jgi:lipopolysaccharide/colanic/teichoic acid biosynthesis glycosyltransferase